MIDPDLPAFIGGAIGFLGFGCSEWFEPSLKREGVAESGDDAAFMFFRSIVAFDHAKQVIKIISLVFAEATDTETDLRERFDAAEARNLEIKEHAWKMVS